MSFDFTNYLGMRRVATKLEPKLFDFNQKQHLIYIAKEGRNWLEGQSWWQNMDLWLWRGNQNLIIPMKAAARVKTKKSAPNSLECEGFT